MVSFDLLPSEIIDTVLENLEKTALLPLRLTSHRNSSLASPHIYAYIVQELQEQEQSHSSITTTTSSSPISQLKQDLAPDFPSPTLSSALALAHQAPHPPVYLHTAAASPDLLTPLQTLLSLHCSPNTINAHNETPLHIAIRHNNLPAVRTLLEAGADANAEIKPHGWTPLLLAARYGFVECVRLLLGEFGREDGNGVDVNKRGYHGWTALHVARRYGHEEVVKLLVERGAREDIRDNDGFDGKVVKSGAWKGAWGVV